MVSARPSRGCADAGAYPHATRHRGRKCPGMSAPSAIDAFVRDLPKAELHVHLQGAASVPTVLELARRHPEAGVPTEAATLRDFYTFTDFDHFIEVYISVNRLVRTADDVEALVEGLGRDLAGVNVRYADVTVTPDSHLLMGIAGDDLAAALTQRRTAVLDQHGVELARVFDIPGELGLQSGLRTIDWAEGRLPGHVPASPRSRPAQRPACGRDHRAADGPPQRRPAGGRAHRPRHLRHSGSGVDGAPRRPGHRPRDLPDVQHLHEGGPGAGRAPLPRGAGRGRARARARPRACARR